MRIVCVIPARWESSRFPGKPLAQIAGESLISRVHHKACLFFDNEDIFVATDDDRIYRHCQESGIQCLITSSDCKTGTDRVYEASKQISEADIIVNIQGDEPLIKYEDIDSVVQACLHDNASVANGMAVIDSDSDFRSLSVPKVVHDSDNWLLYASRAPIPLSKEGKFVSAKRQVCIYAFKTEALNRYGKLNLKSTLESIEDIEILRFLDMQIPVKMVDVSASSIAVDFPEDVEKVEKILRNF